MKIKLIKGLISGLNSLKFSCLIFFKSEEFLIRIMIALRLKPIIYPYMFILGIGISIYEQRTNRVTLIIEYPRTFFCNPKPLEIAKRVNCRNSNMQPKESQKSRLPA
jgi:hypothetical protein